MGARGYSLQVHARHSTIFEWLAKALLILPMTHLRAKQLLVADSEAAAFMGSASPNYSTGVFNFVRKAAKSSDPELHSEIWVQAQHDNTAKGFLAVCNKLSDGQAPASQPGEFPFTRQVPGFVFHVRGSWWCVWLRRRMLAITQRYVKDQGLG